MDADPSNSTTAQDCDVVVIGGGPAGSTTSTLLADRGHPSRPARTHSDLGKLDRIARALDALLGHWVNAAAACPSA